MLLCSISLYRLNSTLHISGLHLTLQLSNTTMHCRSLVLVDEDDMSTSGATMMGSRWSQNVYWQKTKLDRYCGRPVACRILICRLSTSCWNTFSLKMKFNQSQKHCILNDVTQLDLHNTTLWPYHADQLAILDFRILVVVSFISSNHAVF